MLIIVFQILQKMENVDIVNKNDKRNNNDMFYNFHYIYSNYFFMVIWVGKIRYLVHIMNLYEQRR